MKYERKLEMWNIRGLNDEEEKLMAEIAKKEKKWVKNNGRMARVVL